MSNMSGIKDSTTEQVGSVPTPVIQTLSQAALNHLRVAQNKHNDPIIRARAVKELARMRGQHEDIDRFFGYYDQLEKSEEAKKRIAALKNPIR